MKAKKILIVEDESAAARRLVRLIGEIPGQWEVPDILESVSDAVGYFQSREMPDVALMDIHLADGSCFEIFSQVEVSCPVIFITAYDQYAIQAFKVNSIDYLLKPVKLEELQASFRKLEQWRPETKIESILSQFLNKPAGYQRRFIVKSGQYIKTVDAAETAFFYAEDKVVFLQTSSGQKHIVDYSLDRLETLLDPEVFFRINRKVILNLEAIGRMASYFRGKIRIEPKSPPPFDLLVSAGRVDDFKKWIERG